MTTESTKANPSKNYLYDMLIRNAQDMGVALGLSPNWLTRTSLRRELRTIASEYGRMALLIEKGKCNEITFVYAIEQLKPLQERTKTCLEKHGELTLVWARKTRQVASQGRRMYTDIVMGGETIKMIQRRGLRSRVYWRFHDMLGHKQFMRLFRIGIGALALPRSYLRYGGVLMAGLENRASAWRFQFDFHVLRMQRYTGTVVGFVLSFSVAIGLGLLQWSLQLDLLLFVAAMLFCFLLTTVMQIRLILPLTARVRWRWMSRCVFLYSHLAAISLITVAREKVHPIGSDLKILWSNIGDVQDL